MSYLCVFVSVPAGSPAPVVKGREQTRNASVVASIVELNRKLDVVYCDDAAGAAAGTGFLAVTNTLHNETLA